MQVRDDPEASLLAGDRMGLIGRPEAVEGWPGVAGFSRFDVAVRAPAAFAGAIAGPSGSGACWWDERKARAAAVSEACERYCGSLVPGGLTRASWSDLDRAGVAAVRPDGLALHSAEQVTAAGFPFVGLDAGTPVLWASGRRLVTGDTVAVPASIVYLSWLTGPTVGEPPTNFPVSAGVAAGPDIESAVGAARREVLERDALATAWACGWPFPPLAVPSWINDVAGSLGPGADLRVNLVPNRDRLPVVFAAVFDTAHGLVGSGCALRDTVEEGALKAIAEAVVSLDAAAQVADESSPFIRRLSTRAGPLKPWRADRRYLRSYRQDWSDVVDLACHVQLLLDPELQALVHARLAAVPGATAVPGAPMAGRDGTERAGGGSVVVVDVTTADVAEAGITVVRVVAPGRRSTAPAAFPYLSGLPEPPACLAPVPLA